MKDWIIKVNKNKIKFRFLDWDSKFFGIDCYILDLDSTIVMGDYEKLRKIINSDNVPKFITARIPSSYHRKFIDFLLDAGFRYIDTNVILQYQRMGHDYGNKKVQPDILIEKDVSVLPTAILGGVYENSRFHLDRYISKAQADGVWINYIKNFKISDSNHLFTAKVNGKIAGGIFIEQSIKNKVKISNFFLVGVMDKYQGKGVGSKLMLNAVEWCLGNSEVVTVSTQCSNLSALNFYSKNGFSKIKEANLVFHYRHE